MEGKDRFQEEQTPELHLRGWVGNQPDKVRKWGWTKTFQVQGEAWKRHVALMYVECQDSGMGGMSELNWGKKEIRLKGLYCCPEELECIPVSNEEPLKDWVKENKFKIGTPSSVGRGDETTSHGQGRKSTNIYENVRQGHERPSGAWRCLPRRQQTQKEEKAWGWKHKPELPAGLQVELFNMCVYKTDLSWRSRLEKVH